MAIQSAGGAAAVEPVADGFRKQQGAPGESLQERM
jgi:hypothetical protein